MNVDFCWALMGRKYARRRLLYADLLASAARCLGVGACVVALMELLTIMLGDGDLRAYLDLAEFPIAIALFWCGRKAKRMHKEIKTAYDRIRNPSALTDACHDPRYKRTRREQKLIDDPARRLHALIECLEDGHNRLAAAWNSYNARFNVKDWPRMIGEDQALKLLLAWQKRVESLLKRSAPFSEGLLEEMLDQVLGVALGTDEPSSKKPLSKGVGDRSAVERLLEDEALELARAFADPKNHAVLERIPGMPELDFLLVPLRLYPPALRTPTADPIPNVPALAHPPQMVN